MVRALSPDSARIASDLIDQHYNADQITGTINNMRTQGGQRTLPAYGQTCANWARTHYPADRSPYNAQDVRAFRERRASASMPPPLAGLPPRASGSSRPSASNYTQATASSSGQLAGLSSGPGSSQTRPQLPRLNIEPARLRNMLAEGADIQSPVTPDEIEDYANPNRLPSPTNVTHNSVFFGTSVRVPRARAAEYQAVREHMAADPKSRKYLAVVENREEPTTVYPFEAGEQHIQSLDGNYMLPAKTETLVNAAGTGIDLKFHAREGIFTESGGRQSAATGASHEMGHAARMYRDSIRAERNDIPLDWVFSPQGEQLDNGWHNTEEHEIIVKVENGVAKAHGEDQRDTHRVAGVFTTDSITSTNAVNPQAEAVMRHAALYLQQHTAAMDRAGKTVADTNDQDVRTRTEIAMSVQDQLRRL